MRTYADEQRRAALIQQIGDVERRADKITYETVSLLHSTFITPFDRDAIHRLISGMDDILDLIQDAAESMHLFDIRRLPPEAPQMAVQTRSESAIRAQKGVMEFLLINHPLDCPICDQGGECQLQDLAVGYGDVASRYQEEKRVVSNKELGPLISTDMSRCIHCTRCVRFGQEIAGIMEMGQVGRGEHSEIMPFVESTVNSELSGNMIDLCAVGALTSKPFRYTARAWELTRRASISPHDSLGANLAVHVKNNRVMRVGHSHDHPHAVCAGC